MNKSQLAEKLNTQLEGTGTPTEVAKLSKESVDIFFSSIKGALISGDHVEIRGFGSFTLKDYEPYIGRNPKTGEKVQVESKRLPVFKQGKELKKIMND